MKKNIVTTKVLIFDQKKNSSKNEQVFLKYLNTKKKPWSKILADTLALDLTEEEFRNKIRTEVLSYLEKGKQL